jgi:hypothetical protein
MTKYGSWSRTPGRDGWWSPPGTFTRTCRQGLQPRSARLPVQTFAARDLVAALDAVHASEVGISDPPPRARRAPSPDWPGRREGLTDRESEILALITQGRNNAEGASLTYLGPNTGAVDRDRWAICPTCEESPMSHNCYSPVMADLPKLLHMSRTLLYAHVWSLCATGHPRLATGGKASLRANPSL